MYGILIVDDNSLVRMSLVNLINWKRHNATLVAMAHDGNEAFRLCEEYLPHIVITDIKMPGGDGITLMKKIIQRFRLSQLAPMECLSTPSKPCRRDVSTIS